MNLEIFFSTELILENESIVMRPLTFDDIDQKIRNWMDMDW